MKFTSDPADGMSWPEHSLLGRLAPETRKELLAAGTIRDFAPGEVLIQQHSSLRDVYVVVSGCVKVTTTTYDGRVLLLAIRGAGEVVGELAAVDDAPRAATVVAAVPTQTVTLNAARFKRFLHEHPDAAATLQRSTMAKLRQATNSRTDVGVSPVRLRVARFLYELALVHGRHADSGDVIIDIPLTQVELAALVSAAEPTVRNAVRDLRRQQLVDTRYRRLIVCDLEGLRRAARGVTGQDG